MTVRLGSQEQFRILREGLRGLNFTEEAICGRAGCDSIFNFISILDGRTAGVNIDDSLDVLIHLLMDGETLDETLIRSHLPAGLLKTMEALQLVGRLPEQPEQCYATALLYPVESLYIASDRTKPVKGSAPAKPPADLVYAAITENTSRFLSALPQEPCEAFLDLCTGTGIAALLAASRSARHAWASDLGERCALFAGFNRCLNALENLSVVQGDLYEAVEDLTFDCITAHPPYVPHREKDHDLLFRDGGEDGEQVLRRIIEGLPKHLRQSGTFYCVTKATDRKNETFESRIRRWLGTSEKQFDVILVAIEERKRPDMTQNALKAKGHPGKPTLTEEQSLYERLQVTDIFYGFVVIQRRAGAEERPAVTARILRAPKAGREAVDWYVRWQRATVDGGFTEVLLNCRPRLSPHLKLIVTHTCKDGVLTPTDFRARINYPFLVDAVIGSWLAVVLGNCGGTLAARELYLQLRDQEVVPAEMSEAGFANLVQTLASNGLVEIDGFALPPAPGNR